MAEEDYYKTLDVPRSATQAEIQKAYRRLAKKFHPDLHEDKDTAKQQFQKIQAAYDVLGDEEKRKMYDQFGSQFEQMRGAGGGNPFAGQQNPFGGQSSYGGMDIDLEQMFGGARPEKHREAGRGGAGLEDLFRFFGRGGEASAGRQPRRETAQPQNLDHEMDITVPFSIAVLGGEHRLAIERGPKQTETITAKIPAGIETGKRIRLKELGNIGPKGKKGDLFLRVNIAPHPYYRRNGLNLIVMLPVTITEAVLGTKIDLPTPHGTVTLTVPPNSSSGRVLRLKGMGIKTSSSSGDLLAEVEIVVPEHLNKDQQKALRLALAGTESAHPRGDLKW